MMLSMEGGGVTVSQVANIGNIGGEGGCCEKDPSSSQKNAYIMLYSYIMCKSDLQCAGVEFSVYKLCIAYKCWI